VALGASLIEKHYTLNNKLPGADHPFALEPAELVAMVKAIRATEQARGRAGKHVSDAEKELYAFARRGLQTTRAVAKGEVLKLGDNLEILRPGKHPLGAHPRFLDKVEGHRARGPLTHGHGVLVEDVE